MNIADIMTCVMDSAGQTERALLDPKGPDEQWWETFTQTLEQQLEVLQEKRQEDHKSWFQRLVRGRR